MTTELKIEEGTFYSQPHFFITDGEYNHYQRRAPNVSNPNPLSGEEKMLIALCERVLDLTAVNASLRDLAVPSYVRHKFCLRCAEAKGLRRENDAVPESAHCDCCGNFAPLCQYSAQHVADTYGVNKVSSRRAAQISTYVPKKHYYTLTANTHKNKVKILEWMEDSMAEMDAGNAGWIEETVLYPNAVYRKLVTDKDGYLTDPEYISKLVQEGRAQLRKDPSCDWCIAANYGVEYITQRMKEGTQYTVREDGHALPKN
jgi:hypothetical protein